MTSQTLIPNRSSTRAAGTAIRPSNSQTVNDTSGNESDAPKIESAAQGNCQVELRHLQAETEALLQQLQALKQQRLALHSASGDLT